MPTRVAGLVLAAGAGRRYGMPKALVRHEGRLLVDRAAEVARAGGCTPVVVVLGAAAEEVRAAADLAGAVVVENPDWDTGMGSSLRAGLSALAATDAVAAVVLLVDMPGVTAPAVHRLASVATEDALVMAGYGERRGHPVLLGRSHWPGIAELAAGDVGARPYLRRHRAKVRVVSCRDVADDDDLDTPPVTGSLPG
jgi:CTP:molybdopterin cytidylyltransferase MocA